MGNCCKTASSSTTEWGGEDWSFLTSTSNCNKNKKKNSININNNNKRKKKRSSRKVFDELKLNKDQKLHQQLVGISDDHVITSSSSSSSNDSHGKIKIRMTKREFEAFMEEIQEKQKKQNQQLGKVISAEQVLVRLMKASRENINHHHHSLREWSPVLETIPEISPYY